MKRTQRDRKVLDESFAWLRDHWNATNLEVPAALRERWMYEPADDRANPAGFHLAVFTFGLMQYDLISNGVPSGVKRTYSDEMLLSGFARWQLKLALAEIDQRTDVRVRPLPLFGFSENEQIEAWADPDAPTGAGGGTRCELRDKLVAMAEGNQRDRALRIELLRVCPPEIADRASEVFESVSGAAMWLIEPTDRLCGLGGKAPVDLLRTPEGRDAVLKLLGRIEHGIPP